MMRRERLLQNRSLLVSVLAALLLILVGLLLVFMSKSGRGLFGFAIEAPPVLEDDQDIRAWAAFDKPSYRVGDTVRYRVRIVWREGKVTPDLASLETSINFFPLDHIGSTVASRRPGDGLREYTADHALQMINVDTASSYQLDTVIVYYTLASEADTDVHSYRVTPPLVYTGEYYPGEIAKVALQPLKPAIDDARSLRRMLMAACGLAAFGLLLILLWQRVRRRPDAELSPAERLWREFDELRSAPLADAQRVVNLEQLFTQALELRAGISPMQFWSGAAAADGEWQALLTAARDSFGQAYRPDGPTAADVQRIVAAIEKVIGPMVEEERLQHETHDSIVVRLRRQPAVLAVSATLIVAALAAAVLVAFPSTWLADDFKRYNAALAIVASDGDLQQAVDALAELSEQSEDPRVQAATLYNLGTLLADRRLARLSREQHENFLAAMFIPDISLARLLDEMEMDAEFELITLLTELTRQYVQAEQVLKGAARAAPNDPDVGRNLEILGKLRRAIGRSLAALVRQGEEGVGEQQMLSQTTIDLQLLMQAELPDDYAKLDEGKDDREYFIMERF